jgi:hypothetical protein
MSIVVANFGGAGGQFCLGRPRPAARVQSHRERIIGAPNVRGPVTRPQY